MGITALVSLEDATRNLSLNTYPAILLGKGTGMGMAISYQISTEKHGGKLECFFTLGEGSEFIIQLPTQQQVSTAV